MARGSRSHRRAGGGRGGFSGGWDDRLPGPGPKPTYRLAIIGVEYPDVKHNPKITDEDWEESMFSLGTYTEQERHRADRSTAA